MHLEGIGGESQAGDKPQRYGIPFPHASEFRPRIGVRGRLSAGIIMALRRPHRRMKIGRRRVVLSIAWSSNPSPPLLDSSFRWNDAISRGSLSQVVVRDMLSKQSLMPVGAGTPRCEN